MSDTLPRVEILSIIVCDDVRLEHNGKTILVGVYSDVSVANFPVQLTLTFWTEFKVSVSGDIPVKFRIVGEIDDQLFLSGGMTVIAAVQDSISSFAITAPLPLQVPTKLRYQLKQHNEEWVTVRSVSVAKGVPTSTSIARGVQFLGH